MKNICNFSRNTIWLFKYHRKQKKPAYTNHEMELRPIKQLHIFTHWIELFLLMTSSVFNNAWIHYKSIWETLFSARGPLDNNRNKQWILFLNKFGALNNIMLRISNLAEYPPKMHGKKWRKLSFILSFIRELFDKLVGYRLNLTLDNSFSESTLFKN